MVIRSCDSMVQTIASLFTGGMQICPWEFSVAGQGNSWMATTVLNVTDRETVWLLALNWYSCPFSQSVQGLAKLDQGTSPRHLDKAAHFRLHTWGLKRAFQGDDIQNLRILNKVECSPCKGEQGNLFRRNSIFSTAVSELPGHYNLHNFPPVVRRMLSGNEILCQVFNVIPNASYIWHWVGLTITEAKRHRTKWLLPNHNFKSQFPFPPPLEMLNLLWSSSLKGKPFLFRRRLKRKCKSEDKVEWFSFPLSSWAGSTREGSASQHHLRGHSDWGQIWSSCFWLSDSC